MSRPYVLSLENNFDFILRVGEPMGESENFTKLTLVPKIKGHPFGSITIHRGHDAIETMSVRRRLNDFLRQHVNEINDAGLALYCFTALYEAINVFKDMSYSTVLDRDQFDTYYAVRGYADRWSEFTITTPNTLVFNLLNFLRIRIIMTMTSVGYNARKTFVEDIFHSSFRSPVPEFRITDKLKDKIAESFDGAIAIRLEQAAVRKDRNPERTDEEFIQRAVAEKETIVAVTALNIYMSQASAFLRYIAKATMTPTYSDLSAEVDHVIQRYL